MGSAETDTAFKVSAPFFHGRTPDPAIARARERISAGIEHPLVAYGHALGLSSDDMAREAGMTPAQWDERIVRRGYFPPVQGLINLSMVMGIHPAALIHPRAAFTPPEILESLIAMLQFPDYHFSREDRRTALTAIQHEWGRIHAAENDPENGRNLVRFRQVDHAILSEMQAGKSRAFNRTAGGNGDGDDDDSLSFLDDPWADETLHTHLQGPDRMVFYIGALRNKIATARIEQDASASANDASLKIMNGMMTRLWGFRENAARRGVAEVQKEAAGTPETTMHEAVAKALRAGDVRIPPFYNSGADLTEYRGEKMRTHSNRVDAFLSVLETRINHQSRHVRAVRRLNALRAELKAHVEWIAEAKDDDVVMGLYDNRCRLVARGLKMEPRALLPAPARAMSTGGPVGGGDTAGVHPTA